MSSCWRGGPEELVSRLRAGLLSLAIAYDLDPDHEDMDFEALIDLPSFPVFAEEQSAHGPRRGHDRRACREASGAARSPAEPRGLPLARWRPDPAAACNRSAPRGHQRDAEKCPSGDHVSDQARRSRSTSSSAPNSPPDATTRPTPPARHSALRGSTDHRPPIAPRQLGVHDRHEPHVPACAISRSPTVACGDSRAQDGLGLGRRLCAIIRHLRRHGWREHPAHMLRAGARAGA